MKKTKVSEKKCTFAFVTGKANLDWLLCWFEPLERSRWEREGRLANNYSWLEWNIVPMGWNSSKQSINFSFQPDVEWQWWQEWMILNMLLDQENPWLNLLVYSFSLPIESDAVQSNCNVRDHNEKDSEEPSNSHLTRWSLISIPFDRVFSEWPSRVRILLRVNLHLEQERPIRWMRLILWLLKLKFIDSSK